MLSRVVRPVLRKAAGPRRSYHAPAGHFKVPTINELPVPQGSWQESFNSKQRKYNMHLIGGISFFLGTFGIDHAL
ncbi:hypothetical protein B566_EDAN007251 [Ephemera danica]|nr:hypothetical protein B566_EDAN007251 [Ephemera danica]